MSEITADEAPRSARLPRLLGLPFRLVPGVLHSTALATVLDRVLAGPLRDGELDFLFGRTLALRVEDTGVEYRLFLGVGGFYAGSEECEPDVVMTGTLYDFLVLAAREEDPDTLFFQRRLRLSGSTELGLQFKNLLDSVEFGLEALPPEVVHRVESALETYRRWFGRRTEAGSS